MVAERRITFHRSSPPYEAGDSAGFPPLHARRLVDRGVATYSEPEGPPDLAAMDRAALLRYAVDVLGMEGEPPADLTDEEIRAGIAAQLGDDGMGPTAATAPSDSDAGAPAAPAKP